MCGRLWIWVVHYMTLGYFINLFYFSLSERKDLYSLPHSNILKYPCLRSGDLNIDSCPQRILTQVILNSFRKVQESPEMLPFPQKALILLLHSSNQATVKYSFQGKTRPQLIQHLAPSGAFTALNRIPRPLTYHVSPCGFLPSLLPGSHIVLSTCQRLTDFFLKLRETISDLKQTLLKSRLWSILFLEALSP